MGQTWKIFRGFQFSRFGTYRIIPLKLDDAKISHFTVFGVHRNGLCYNNREISAQFEN